MTKYLPAAALILLGICVQAIANDSAWPGGIAYIDLGDADGLAPVVEYDGKRVLVMNDDGRWRAAVGVPLDKPAGPASIRLADGTILSFDIDDHTYREQHLEVSQSYVSLSEENLERVGRERKIIGSALTN